MNLRERLRSLGGTTTRSTGNDRSGPSAVGRQSDDPDRERRAADTHRQLIDCRTDSQALDFGADIPLHSFPTEAGPAVGTETFYSQDYEQGRIPLDTALDVPDAGWMRLLPMADRPFPIKNAVFLDLETTGLARGAGTYAFLIGVGRFNGDGFRLRQFFMRDYDEELTHLEALRTELQDAEAIVTFNGRSFDWPLLETRAIMNRLRLPLLPHLDLLHPARRVWRPIIGGCRLVELEEEVLGVQREDDVPGHLIPQRYFDFLQTGDAAPLADVLVHNRLDILSMVALVGHLGQALAAPRRRGLDEALSGAELFTIGRWLLPDEEGVACLEEALYRGLPTELRRQCRRLLATAYRRAGRAEEALPVLEKLVDDDGLSTWAYIELAKHYEHRARDFATARQWTVRALDVLQRRRQLGRTVGRGAGAGEATRTAPAMGLGTGSGTEPGARPGPDHLDEELTEVLHRLRRVERKHRRNSS